MKAFLPAQDRLLHSHAKYVLAHGPVRSGKSEALCLDVLGYSEDYPKSSCILIRRKSTDLDILFQTFRECLWGPAARGMAWEQFVKQAKDRNSRLAFKGWRAGDRVLTLANGSVIRFGFLRKSEGETAENELGGGYDFIGVSQAEGLDDSDFSLLTSRLSGKVGPQRMVYECNPDLKSHYLHKMFLERLALPNSEAIQFPVKDNLANLPEGWWEANMANPDENWKRRYLFGEWGIVYEGVVYGMFLEKPYPEGNLIVRPTPEEIKTDYYRVTAGVDKGFTHDAYFNVWGKRKDGVSVKLAQVGASGKVIDDLMMDWEPYRAVYPIDSVSLPHDAPDWYESMRRRGWPVRHAEDGPNTKYPGLSFMQAGYQTRRLLWCSDLDTTDLLSYRYKDSVRKGDETGDEGADNMDADRMTCWSERNKAYRKPEEVKGHDFAPGQREWGRVPSDADYMKGQRNQSKRKVLIA